MPVRHDDQVKIENSSGRVRIWVLVLVPLAVLAVLAGATTAMLVAHRDEVTKGTSIAGQAVGGMTRSQLAAVLAGPVTDRVQRTITLHVGDDTRSIQPSAAGITLNADATETAVFAVGKGTLRTRLGLDSGQKHDVAPVVSIDGAKLTQALTAQLSGFTRTAKNASATLPAPQPVLSDKGDTSFAARSAGATVTPAVDGQRVDVPIAATKLRAAASAGRTDVTLDLVVTKAEITTTEASEVDQLIGTFTTLHPCCAPRVTNIQRIAELVDGKMIAPGETFSLNEASGRRTLENGFVAAPAIAEGELVQQVGGGVSQFSTTLFNAAWFSGLTILKHQPHSKYISRYPPGREATLDFDTIDQVIRNDTKVPVVIRASTTPTAVTVALYGHTGDRSVSSVTSPRRPRTGGGFSVTVQRSVHQDDAVVQQDTISWSYTGLD
jgi:vancomycin resistance protein YoaR